MHGLTYNQGPVLNGWTPASEYVKCCHPLGLKKESKLLNRQISKDRPLLPPSRNKPWRDENCSARALSPNLSPIKFTANRRVKVKDLNLELWPPPPNKRCTARRRWRICLVVTHIFRASTLAVGIPKLGATWNRPVDQSHSQRRKKSRLHIDILISRRYLAYTLPLWLLYVLM